MKSVTKVGTCWFQLKKLRTSDNEGFWECKNTFCSLTFKVKVKSRVTTLQTFGKTTWMPLHASYMQYTYVICHHFLPLCHLQAISILFASKVAFINVRNFEGSECRSLILPFYLFGVSQYNERQSSVWVITGPNNVIHYIMGFLTWLERWMGLGWGWCWCWRGQKYCTHLTNKQPTTFHFICSSTTLSSFSHYSLYHLYNCIFCQN